MRMTSAPGQQAQQSPAHGLAEAQFARVSDGGSARHPFLADLLGSTGAEAARDLADAVHLLCHLHGRHPGLIDLALSNCSHPQTREWLVEAADQFERERLYLVRLTAAVGPLPSTPGATQTENAILGQRHAIETLACSERHGCALGASTALIADWNAIRPLLDRAAARAGVQCPLSSLPGESSMARVIESSVDSVAAQRALLFGGEQLILQHRGLLDLLEARADARVD